MRNPEEDRKLAVYECLEECGLNEVQMEKAKKYLNFETDSIDLGITTKEVYTAPGNEARNEKLYAAIQRLSRHRENELGARYFTVLFEIFGVSLQRFYNNLFGIHEYIAKDIRIAIEATKCSNGNGMGRKGNQVIILNISENKEDMIKALAYTDKQFINTDFTILSTLFYDGKETREWNGKGLSDPAEKNTIQKIAGLFTGTADAGAHFETNDAVMKYGQEFKRYQEMFTGMLYGIFYDADNEIKNKIHEYLMTGDNGRNLLSAILSGLSSAKINENLSTTFIPVAVLNYRLSPVIYRFFKICLGTQHMEFFLDLMKGVPYKNDMFTEMKRWFQDFSPDALRFIKWLGKRRSGMAYGKQGAESDFQKMLCEMTTARPDAYLEAVQTAPIDVQDNLVAAAKIAEGGYLYREKIVPMMGGEKANYRNKVASQIIPTTIDAGIKLIAEDYLFGRSEISTLYGHEKVLVSQSYYANVSAPILSYVKVYGQDEFYERCVAFIGFRCMEGTIVALCCKDGAYDFSTDLVKAVLTVMKAGGLDIAHRMKVAEVILDTYRGRFEEKMEALVQLYEKELEEKREELTAAFLGAGVNGRLIGVSVLNRDCVKNKNELLRYLQDSSKQVREQIIGICGEHEEWTEDILNILKNSKKSAEREAAATILAKYSTIMTYEAQLREIIEKEKSKKVIDLIRAVLCSNGAEGMEEGEGDAGVGAAGINAEDYVKECHRGGKKRGLAWINETADVPMPVVHKKATVNGENGEEIVNGEEASEEYLQAILLTYSSMPVPGVNPSVRILTDGVNEQELAAYMENLFQIFLANGAEAKKKWVLYAASIHGGSRLAEQMKHQIDDWAEHSRGAMAAEATKALSLNNSPIALLMVDAMARKYKFKQVRKAAQDAMAFAAEQLGLTVEELADRIVPDLGFDEKMERHFDYGTRTFTVRISPTLEIEVKDETGKKLKSLPAVGKSDDEEKASAALEAFKELKKQMKATVKNQALRLELAMSLDRRWTVENWKKLFVMNPIMHQFAISLIWGHYKDGALVGAFRYMEDGTFNTVDEDEYELTEEGTVGLMHPIEMDQETIAAWKEQLSDYEITQTVQQLDRPVFRVEEDEKDQKRLERFGGKMLNGLSLAGKLTTLGWMKGTPEDAGVYVNFYRCDPDAGYGTELLFSGSYIGDENDEVTVYDAGFYTLEEFDKKGHGYFDPVAEQNRGVKLGEVSPRYFSEIITQLTKATASSTETNEKWREEK